MATQDLTSAAREVVDAFNAADWERCKAILTEDSVYDEGGHISLSCGSRRDHSRPPSMA